MSAIVSKADGTLIVTVRLTLKPGRDDDLIAVVQSSPKRCLAATVREAMRGGTQRQASATTLKNEADLSGLGMDV